MNQVARRSGADQRKSLIINGKRNGQRKEGLKSSEGWRFTKKKKGEEEVREEMVLGWMKGVNKD